MTSVAPVSVVLVARDQTATVASSAGRSTPAEPPTRGMPQRPHALPCEQDPELFFPVGDRGPAIKQIRAAKTLCRRCPITAECLEKALDLGADEGVWGGMTATERRALVRRRRRAGVRR